MHKHLAGQHNQQSHAGKNLGGLYTVESVADALNVMLKTSKHASIIGDVARVELSPDSLLGVPGVSVPRPIFKVDFSKVNVKFSISPNQNSGFGSVMPEIEYNPGRPPNVTGEIAADIATDIAKALGLGYVTIHSSHLPIETLVKDDYIMRGQAVQEVIDNKASFMSFVSGFTRTATEAIRRRKPDMLDGLIQKHISDQIANFVKIADKDFIHIDKAPLIVTYGITNRRINGLVYKKIT